MSLIETKIKGIEDKFFIQTEIKLDQELYEKVPSKIKNDVEDFLKDQTNSVFIVEDIVGSLLENPVKTFCWEKPTEEFLKLNTDGSFKKLPNGSVAGGCATVVRNWLGDVVSQTSWALPCATSSLDVEFSGVYLGVLFKVLASVDDYRIQHQFREGNSVANELASLAMPGVVTDMEDLYGVYTHVEADRQNRARFRINQSLKKLKMSKNS